ncbi:MAG: alpha-L-arabinofuranosidase C-terminal domain-containing protein [Limisphaerales bacterium]
MRPRLRSLLPHLVAIKLGLVLAVHGADAPAQEAALVIHAAELASYPIPRNLTGKFCEHLGANIYNGMDAQVLRNPTFADYPFATGQTTPDGVVTFQFGREGIEGELRRQALRCGWPDDELQDLLDARRDGLAAFWSRAGSREAVRVSPDTGPQGGRAQRIEFTNGGGGIKQWTWLPLHRTRQYEFELLARSPNLTALELSITPQGGAAARANAAITGLSTEWRHLTGTLTLAEDSRPDAPCCLVLSSPSAGQLVVGHLFLRPADHLEGADPDVVRLLKEARLPLLRWPGGNFVSAYHWRDGVGPVEGRPTLPNYAWGGVEPNTFGTDEFIRFCRAVGCEPMICVNAGTGTPEEAARWVEYCNGPPGSPMGALRTANGHPEPYHVRHWEVGNELWGRWQAHWTTASGYVDRYQRFAQAMLKADPTVQLAACGAPVMWGKAWNDTLIAGAGPQLHSITDHPLIGGDVTPAADPMDVFRDFMLVPDLLERKWGELRQDMERGGVRDGRLAVTELQMFAHLAPGPGGQEARRLDRQNLVNPATLAEALYDTCIYHAAVRLQPFVEMVTHSATVNHGGGLRKEHERVYPNPCYYANLLFADFAGARAAKSELRSPSERAPMILPDIKNEGGTHTFDTVDALAALGANGDLLLSLVHRGAGRPIRLTVQLNGFSSADKAQLRTLTGPRPWAANTLEEPAAIQPISAEAEVRDGSLTLVLQPYSVVQARFVARQ